MKEPSTLMIVLYELGQAWKDWLAQSWPQLVLSGSLCLFILCLCLAILYSAWH